MIVSGILQNRYGNRITILLGGILLCLTMLSTYWAVNNFYTFCVTFGVMNGIACGLIYSAPLSAGSIKLYNSL